MLKPKKNLPGVKMIYPYTIGRKTLLPAYLQDFAT